jgi:hypothetical protein
MAGEDGMMGDWNAEDCHIQQVIGERRTASAWEYHVVIYIKKWVLKAAVQLKLLKQYRVGKAMACPLRRSSRHIGGNAASHKSFWYGRSCM